MVDLSHISELEMLKLSGYRQFDTYELIVKVEKIHLGFKLRVFVKGTPNIIELFCFRRPERLLINNWQSWGPSKVIDSSFRFTFPEELKAKFGFSASPMPEYYYSHLVSDYYIGASDFFVGALASRIAHPFFEINDDAVSAKLNVFSRQFDNWTELEPLVILRGDLDQLLPHYADLVAVENKTVLKAKNYIGWSSWYQYFLDFDRGKMLEDLDLAPARGYEVFQIDDAWERDIGDWESNEKFMGLNELARTISEKGFVPGIWLAPFSVAETSKLFREHPDWVVKNECGEPLVAYENWNKRIYALDTTHPEARKWLSELFTELKSAGFGYFKIDFLFAGAIPGVRHVACSPVEAYREGLETIREAVGDAFVLGCGAPLLPSVGFVDGMRIGADTAPFWDPSGPDIGYPNAFYALRNVLTRWFTNGVLWWNDPDCLLLRLEDTQLSDQHRRMFSLTSALLDNMIIQSDRLSYKLDEELWKTIGRLKSYGKRIVKLKGLIDGTYEIVSCGVDGCHTLRIEDLASASFSVIFDEGDTGFVKKVEKRPDGRTFNYYHEALKLSDAEPGTLGLDAAERGGSHA